MSWFDISQIYILRFKFDTIQQNIIRYYLIARAGLSFEMHRNTFECSENVTN